MRTIGFFMLSEPGHLNPSFTIAKRLQRRGYRVCFFGQSDYADHISAQGLEFIPIFDSPAAEGTEERQETKTQRKSFFPRLAGRMEGTRTFLRDLMSGQIEELFNRTQLDLLIVDSLLPFVALIAYKLKTPVVMLSVTLPRNKDSYIPPLSSTLIPGATRFAKFRTNLSWYSLFLVREISSRLTQLSLQREVRNFAIECRYPLKDIDTQTFFIPTLNLPELILCPEEFDFPRKEKANRHYIEAGIDQDRKEDPFPADRINDNRPLIFCTLGSQSHQYKVSTHFFQTVIEALSRRPDWQLLLAIGEGFDVKDFQPAAPNITVVNWAPHATTLKRSSIMINHGGLGTVKECIYHGVPMIVFPISKDHPGNAARVQYHGLGVMGRIREVSAEQIHRLIDRLAQEPVFKSRSQAMSEVFKKAEASNKGVKIIETILRQSHEGTSQRGLKVG